MNVAQQHDAFASSSSIGSPVTVQGAGLFVGGQDGPESDEAAVMHEQFVQLSFRVDVKQAAVSQPRLQMENHRRGIACDCEVDVPRPEIANQQCSGVSETTSYLAGLPTFRLLLGGFFLFLDHQNIGRIGAGVRLPIFGRSTRTAFAR